MTQLTRYGRLLAATAATDPAAAPSRSFGATPAQRAAAPSASGFDVLELQLHGELDVDALHGALQDLRLRHEALRLCPGEPEQLRVPAQMLLDLLVEDLADEPATARTAILEQRLQEARRPELPSADAWLQARLVRLADRDHRLLLSLHPLLADRRSLSQLATEIGRLYTRRRGSATVSLLPAPSFIDYATAVGQGSDAELGDDAGMPITLLPTDRPRGREPDTRLGHASRMLAPSRLRAWFAFAAEHAVEPRAALAALVATWIARLGGEYELVLDVVAPPLAPPVPDGLVGRCEAAWPLRLDLAPEQTPAALLATTAGALQALLQGAPPLAGLVRPTVAMAVRGGGDAVVSGFDGLDVGARVLPPPDDRHELTLEFVLGTQPRIECHYQRALFDAATISHWLESLDQLLGAHEHADTALAALPVLGDGARAAIAAWQPVFGAAAEPAWLHEAIEQAASRHPDRTALHCIDGRLSYAELIARSRRLARVLIDAGVEPGHRVGVCLDRRRDLVPVLLAVHLCGAAYVPLDPGFPAERLGFMVEDAGLRLVVSSRSLLGSVSLPPGERLLLDADRDRIERADDGPLPPRTAGMDAATTPAYVIYTSGSTGKPKGVVVPHAAVMNFLLGMAETPGLTEGERLLAVTTLSFDIAVLELFLPLVTGGECVLATREQAADGRELRRLLEDSAAQVLQATPATWRMLLDAGFQPPAGFRALCGGEALPADLATRLTGAGVELWNMYGPTETTVWSTCWRVVPRERGITIGRPIRNTHVQIVDGLGQVCPVGVSGEIVIGGDGVTLGYLGRPELTADRFVDDPFMPVAADGAPRKLYRTGDRGRWASDGLLEHQGRFDHQVKLRGYRIELGEIESRLSAQEGVARSLVIVREDRPGDQRLVAYVVPRAGHGFHANHLRAALRRFLPEYMVPQHFVALAELPRLPNGKTDRAALPPPAAADGVPPRSSPRGPADPTEVMVSAAMADVLGRPVPRVDQDFFELGGHSLLAAQLIARLNREFRVSLDVRAVFDAPTVELLSAALRACRRSAAGSDDAITAGGDRRTAPLSPDQSRLWLLQSLNPSTVAYNTPSAHRLCGALDEAAFQRAFTALVQRQPSLRTAIERDGDGQLLQVIHEVDALSRAGLLTTLFPAEDLRGWSDHEREAELQRRMQLIIDAPFDLSRAPLFRARMYRLADDEHVLLFVPHDIVWDGWSSDLFVEEMAALYAGELSGVPAELPTLPIAYGDYAAWHARWLQGPAYAEQRRFWRERLARHPQVVPLPSDRPRRSNTSGRGGSDWVRIPGWLTESLHAVARDGRTTLYSVLLAAYTILIGRMAGAREVVIATPLHARSHEQIEPLMGQFTKLLPLSLQIDAEQDFLGLLRHVRDVVLECFGHPDVQLEDLLAALPSEPGAGRPLYHALFSLQDVRQWPRRWGDLGHEQVHVVQQGATEDFGLWLVEHADGLSGAVMFNAEHFDRATATLFRDQFLSLIAQIAERPRDSLRSLSRPAPFERDRLAGWGHGRHAPEVGADSLTARFRRIAACQPQAPAVVEGSRAHGYRALARAIASASTQLRTVITVGDVVIVGLPHGLHRIAAIFGALSVGAVPLLIDAEQPIGRIADRLDALDPKNGARHWLLAEHGLAQALRWPARQWIEPKRLRLPCDARQELLRTPACSKLLLPREREDGSFELVAVGERALLALDSGLREHGLFRIGSRVAVLARPDMPRSLIECLLPLMVGASIVIDPPRRTLAGWLGSDMIDTVLADHEAWQREFEAGWRGRDGLTTVADGSPRALPGEPDPAELRGRHFHAFGDERAGLWSVFGAAGDIARVLPSRRMRVLNAFGDACAIGVFGELRLAVHSFDGAVTGDVAVGHARWRADGSLEPQRDVVGAALPAQMATTIRSPQSPLQALFHDLWSDVLGHADFGIDDSFFDLGGYSLIAVRMFHQAEQQTGVNLPLATLYRAPTISALAAAFAAAGSRVSDTAVRPSTIPAAEDVWRPLVPIRPAGRTRPLFLIHAVGGNVMNYRVLARALPPDVPVYGLQAVGLDGVTPPLSTIEAMAERYVSEIQGQQPKGPYRLGGGSMGGVIAYEIARRLRERGEQVELLAMIDTEMPQWREAVAAGPTVVRSRRARIADALRGGPGTALQAVVDSLVSRSRNVADRLAVLWHRSRGRALPHAIRYRHLQRISLAAGRAYVPGPYDGEITLFLASDGRSRHDFDTTLGWRQVVGDRVRVVPVGGTHEDVIGRASLAAALAAALEACERKEP